MGNGKCYYNNVNLRSYLYNSYLSEIKGIIVMFRITTTTPMPQCKTPRRTMEKSIYDNDFTEDEIACLKKMIYRFRQEEILELYNKRKVAEWELSKTYRTTVSGAVPGQEPYCEPKSFLVKAKNFVKNCFHKDAGW